MRSRPSPKLIKLLNSAQNNQHPKLQLVISARQRDMEGPKDMVKITPALKIGDDEAKAEVRTLHASDSAFVSSPPPLP